MSNLKTKPVEMVTTTCTECGDGFDQPHGAVNTQVCATCLTRLAARFWAIFDSKVKASDL